MPEIPEEVFAKYEEFRDEFLYDLSTDDVELEVLDERDAVRASVVLMDRSDPFLIRRVLVDDVTRRVADSWFDVLDKGVF